MGERVIHFTSTTTSTNDLAQAAAMQASPGTVWATDFQEAGRGRRGPDGRRVWLAPPGSSVLMSLLLRPGLPLERASVLTVAAAVGCAEALSRCAGVEVGLKWPNDLLFEGRKLGGILTEAHVFGAAVSVVVGVGINVNVTDFDPSIRDLATSVELATGQRADRLTLITAIAEAIEEAVAQIGADGTLGPLQARWEARSAMVGRRVLLTAGPFAGARATPLGLAPDGALRVELDHGEHTEVRVGELIFVQE